MRARVPASSANLGPGFDALAVALSLYIEVTVTDADEFSISSSGFGAGLFDTRDHLAATIVSEVLGHDRYALHVHSDIPLSRGLGSSASLALAAAAAAGSSDPLAIAARVDGHVENAAASLLGGLVIGGHSPLEGWVARPLPLDEAWRFVVVIPELELATADARRVLPSAVPFVDAVHNLNAMGLLIAGLANARAWSDIAMNDYLHQPYRMPLLAFAEPLLATMKAAGAAGTCWSGAGSTMLALVTAETEAVVVAAAATFVAESNLAASVRVLEADRVGLVVSNV
jgi:homoserine kinase